MTPHWTPDAVQRLDEYLDETRRQLSAETGIDHDEVIDDLRAHVHAELRDVRTPVTRDALERVLHTLGSPAEPRRDAASSFREWTPALMVFGLFATGILLFAYVPYLVILSAIVARAVVAREGSTETSGGKVWLILPPLVLIWTMIVGAVLSGPFFPAGEILVRRAGGTATPAVLAALGIVLGMWWLLLAGLVAAARRGVSWFFRPLPLNVPMIARLLATAGAVVAVIAASALAFLR